MTTDHPSTSPKSHDPWTRNKDGHSRRAKPEHKIRLRELTVRNAKPGAKAYMLWDETQRGLGLRVLPTGSKSWKAVYSRSSGPRWYHIGNADSISLADARLKAAEIMVAVAKGHDPQAERKAERGAGTFAELAAKYVVQHAKKHNKSWKQADTLIGRYVLPRLGKLQATTITRTDIKTMLSRIEAPILANQVLASVSPIFTWAKREEILTGENPCRLISRNDTTDRERVLADSEVPLFWTAFDDAGLIVSTALKVILLSGQRPGEIAHMRREHIVDGGWWIMPGDPTPDGFWPGTKNESEHRIWLSAPVQALLAELSDDDAATGYVFAGARRGRPVTRLDAAMRSICAKLGVARATPHDLRRTFSTTVASLGFGTDALNRVTNHKEGGIASVYDRHHYSDENKRIMEATAARLLSLAEGRTDDSKVVPFTR
jgi:integrase